MKNNPCNIKYVLVHGRRAEFEGNEKRTNLIRSYKHDDFDIASYDSLVESLQSRTELYLAVRKNEHIEVLSRLFITDGLFAGLHPTYIKITDELRKSILDNKISWRHYTLGHKLVLEDTLPQIGVLNDHCLP